MNKRPALPHRTEEYRSIHGAVHLLPFEDNNSVDTGATRIMVRGEGVHLWDSEGNRFLDGMSGLWCTAVGYARPELIAAATQQLQQLSFCSQYFNITHPAVVRLSAKLLQLLPGDFSKILYTNSGSEANETLIRVVRRYWDVAGKPDKKQFISLRNGYHGSTVGSASLGGMKLMHEMGDLPIPGVHHIDEPYWYGDGGALTEHEFGLQAAGKLEQAILRLGSERVAAFVAEPFLGAGGMIFPPASYWPEIQRICRKHDVLLCADEVIGGFGRTGQWFAHQHFDFQPDTLTIAKALTSGYIPMGGLVLSTRIASALAEKGGVFAHGLTYQGHPAAAAVALANLQLLDEGGIVEQVRQHTGPYFQRRLREVFGEHVMVGEIQGAGMVAALQLVAARDGRRRFMNEGGVGAYCTRKALEQGLIVRPQSARIIMAPPLVSTRDDIEQLLGKLKAAVDQTARALEML